MPRTMTEVAAAPGAVTPTGTTPPAPSRHRIDRHPGDLIRLVTGLVLTGLALAASLLTRNAVAGLEADVYRLVAGLLPDTALRVVVAAVQMALLVTPLVVVIGIIVYRHWRAALMGLVAGAATSLALLLLDRLIDRVPPAVAVPGDAFTGDGILPADFPPVWVAGAATAAIAAASPWITRPWRRTLWGAVFVAALSRLLTGTELPVDLLFVLAFGWTVGSATLVAFGSPRPVGESPAAVATTLRANGLRVDDVTPLPSDIGGSQTFVAHLDGGKRLFVTVQGRDERDADALLRIYRFLRYRGVEDESPFLTAKRALEHEALCGLMARRFGARVPEVELVASAGEASTLLACEYVEGHNLRHATTPGDLDDGTLRAVWEQVRAIHDGRLAHRDLNRSNVIVDSGGLPWLIGFGYAEMSASGRRRAIDVAELLCSTAVVVGAERAATAACDVLGAEAVAAALPFLQIPALSRSTRRQLRAQKGLLDEVRTQVEQRTGVEAVELEKLVRVSGRSVLYLLLAVGVVYVLLPQLGDLEESWQAVLEANWAVLPVVFVMVALTYLANAFVFMGSLDVRLPVGKATAAQLASAFANRVTPANVGGMAVRIRFLQKRGIDAATAASTVGLNSGATGAVKAVLLVLFVLITGFGSLGDFDLDAVAWVALAVVAVLAAGWVVLFGTTWGRTKVLEPGLRALRNALHNLRAVLTSPAKVLLIIGGSVLLYLANIAALFATLEAFGGGLSFSKVAVVYLGGTTIAGAAPTPGNMGAVEAALIAGLSAAGLDPAVATSVTLVFRLIQYWLPTIPAWFVFRHLEHTDQI